MTNLTFDLCAATLLAASICRSTDPHRPQISGVYVEPLPGGGVSMVAVDGHIMAILRDGGGSISRPAILSMDWSDKGLKAAAKADGGRVRDWKAETPREALAEAVGRHGERLGLMTVTDADWTFPAWRNVVPQVGKDVKPDGTYSWNVALLSRIEDSVRTLFRKKARDEVFLSFLHQSPTGPALIQYGGINEYAWVAMPGSKSATHSVTRPAWMDAAPTAIAAE